MELDVLSDDKKTEVGSYFVSNYPPFSAWSPDHLPAVWEVVDRPPARPDAPLGLYLHIPFCRQRCHFCYFRVYTDKNSREIETYMEALAREIALHADKPFIGGREFEFVYFGGGTPSYLSSEQLRRLVERINRYWRWDHAKEVTFECEPGTLKKSKLQTLRDLGVTRLSLGVEHFDDDVLTTNNRAHKTPEILRAYDWAREVGFPQINVDLIAGMVGDVEEKWKATVEKTLALDPDCLTVYQMEVPRNTTLAREAREHETGPPVADWATKRRWVDHAFDLFKRHGYVASSAYTVVKPTEDSHFQYRDSLWRGADMVGTGVASFSHVQGVHYQNFSKWEEYLGSLERGELPLSRALPMTESQKMTREWILQMKLGGVEIAYFKEKFGLDPLKVYAEPLAALRDEGFAEVGEDRVSLTRAGLPRVDGLLPRFFEPEFRDSA